MRKIHTENRLRSRALKQQIKKLVYHELTNSFYPYWFISFHYTDNKTDEEEIIKDVGDLKNKIRRTAYSNRDRAIKNAGSFPYPKIIFFNEKSHLGTEQYHTHLILEAMPASMNTQAAMEDLFKKILPDKVKSLSKWKSINVQRISTEPEDLLRLSQYLSKQSDSTSIALDAINSDLSSSRNYQKSIKQ